MSKLLCPDFAIQSPQRMPTRGGYPKGFPFGAVVHHTAGHDGAEKTIAGGVKNGFAFWVIQRDGALHCAHDADRYGYHCGESKWLQQVKKLGGGGMNSRLIGIEICAYGRLDEKGGKLYTYFGKEVPRAEARYCDGSSPDQCKGWYHRFTPEQEATLMRTLLWLKRQRPDVFDFDCVLAHAEISGKLGLGYWRKNDPSASLSLTMPQLRAKLKAEYAK